MQRCTRPGSTPSAATSSSSTITSPSTPPTPCRSTSTGGESGRVRARPDCRPVNKNTNEQQARLPLFPPASGHANASFCPHAYGCRDVLVSENQIILDVTDHEVFLTVQIPAGRMLWLVSSSPCFYVFSLWSLLFLRKTIMATCEEFRSDV